MSRTVWRATTFATAVCSLSLPALAWSEPAKAPLRPSDLIESPSQFVNHTVEVEIVERLSGVGEDAYAQTCVNLPEAFSCILSLVPPTFRADDPDRYKLKFDAPITAPVRVRGELLRDDGLTGQLRLPGYVVRVSSVEPLPAETPTRVDSVAELLAQRERWDRHRIVIEGTWRRGFEISYLGRDIWLRVGNEAEVVGLPKAKAGAFSGMSHVRVTGLLFARPGRRYGHMSSAAMLLLASKVEYLGPGR